MTHDTPLQPGLEALKTEVGGLQEQRRFYFNSLSPPFSEQQKQRLQELDNLALDALSRFYATREQQK